MYFADLVCYWGFQVKPQNSLLTANEAYRTHTLHLQHQYINNIFRISAFLIMSQVLFYLKLCIDPQNSTENGLKCPQNNCKLGLASKGQEA